MDSRVFIDKELEQINFLDDRFYQKANGVYYPSLTHICGVYPKGEAFIQWLKDVGNQAKLIADRAAESGSLVHDGIEKICSKLELSWNPDVYGEEEWKGLLKFEDFYKNFVEEIYCVETKVCSDQYKFGGTLDLVAKLNDGNVWLIDHKFSNSIYKSHFIQVFGYKMGWEEMGSLKINKVGILHLKSLTRGRDKKGKSIQGEGWRLVEPPYEYSLLEKMVTNTIITFYFDKVPSGKASLIKEYKNNIELIDMLFKTCNLKPKNRIYPITIKLKSKWKNIS